MNRITFFRKGGKLYYRKGGRIFDYETGGPIELGPRREKTLLGYQYGGSPIQPLDSTQSNITDPAVQQVLNENIEGVDAPDFDTSGRKIKVNKDGLANIGNLVGSALSNVNRTGYNPESEHTANVTRGYQNTAGTVGDIKSGVTGIISGINPLVGAAINVGTGLSGAVKGKDKHGIANSEAQEVIGNIISPSEKFKESIAVGQRFGGAEGLANYFTFGASGRRKRLEDIERARKEDQFIEGRKNLFNESGQGANKNSTIYARYGKEIKTPRNRLNGNWNAEIEDGEIVLGDPSQMEIGGNAKSSLVSPFAAKFNGDKHGVDSDGDGQEGIPIKAQEGAYVASDYLGLNGKKAKGKEKTVSKVMEPIVDSLANADTNSPDVYKNNPQFIENQLNQLESIKNEAETNKASVEFKKLLNKRNKQPGELSQFIKENSEYLAGMYSQSPSGLPKMKHQTGGKIRGDLETYAKDELDVPEHIARQAQEDDASLYNFQDPENYKQYDVTAFKTENIVPRGDTPDEVEVEELDRVEDSRQGIRQNIRTLGEQAGKSKFTGSSNLIQEKISEMLGSDVFSGEGKLSPQWINKLVNEHGVSREDAQNATMENVTKGDVGKAFGMMLKDAYGVLGKGRDEQSRNVDPNVSGKTDKPVINNKVEWAQNILDDIKGNDNILPSQYNNLPDDLKDQLLDLARNDKMAHEGRFSTSLSRAFSDASTADTTEIDRQASTTFTDDEVSANRIDENYDLNTEGVDGKSLSFGEAFKYARQNNLPTFTWKGKSFAAKTKSEAPELAAIKGDYKSQPTSKTKIKKQEMARKVKNPSRKLTKVKKGGKMSMMNKMMYRMGGMYNPEMHMPIRMAPMRMGGMHSMYEMQDKGMMPMGGMMMNKSMMNKPMMGYQMGGHMQYPMVKPGFMGNKPMMQGKDKMNMNMDMRRHGYQSMYRMGGKHSGMMMDDDMMMYGHGGPMMKNMSVMPYMEDYSMRPSDMQMKMSRKMNPYTNNYRMGGNMMGMKKMKDLGMMKSGGMMKDKMMMGKKGMMMKKMMKKMMQEGGMMGEEQMPNESNAHMQQLMQEQMAQDPNAAMAGMEEGMGMEQGMEGQGQVPQPIMQLAPELQQAFMQLPPEQQEQLLSLPPDQIEIALMNLMQQMGG